MTFEWTGSDGTTPISGLVYSYKLEGYDVSWSAWSSATSKTYSNLLDGSYTFKVKAKDKSGIPDYTPAERLFTTQLAPGLLAFSPVSHDFGLMTAGSTRSTTFEIWNSEPGTLLTYSLSGIASWMSVTPTSGSSTGEHDTITVSIDTTGFTPGLYTCSVDISSNGGSGTFMVSVTVSDDVLDQQQTQYNSNYAFYTTRWCGQSFIPTVTSLTRVEVYIRKAGTPASDMVLSIRSFLTGADLVSVSKPASQIPTTISWVEFDFSDLTVTPGSTYYLVLRTSGGSSTSCYYWGYGSGTPYTNGMRWNSMNSGSAWTQSASSDFCFKTYGRTPPVLSLNPVSYNFGSVYQGYTGSTSFEIWNSGTGTLTYSLSESSSLGDCCAIKW